MNVKSLGSRYNIKSERSVNTEVLFSMYWRNERGHLIDKSHIRSIKQLRQLAWTLLGHTKHRKNLLTVGLSQSGHLGGNSWLNYYLGYTQSIIRTISGCLQGEGLIAKLAWWSKPCRRLTRPPWERPHTLNRRVVWPVPTRSMRKAIDRWFCIARIGPWARSSVL